MKVIAMTAFNRPELLRETLQRIFLNNREGWTIYLSLDENSTPAVHKVACEFDEQMPMQIWRNSRQYGCALNTFVVCRLAISDGADAVIYMDDDVHLSPDALDMCNWYLATFQDPTTNAGIALCRKDDNDPSKPEFISAKDTWMGHLGQGYCFSRAMWFDFVLRQFWTYRPDFVYDNYDWAWCYMAQKLGKTILRPRFARAKHAAHVGYHGPGIGAFPEVIANCPKQDYRIE